MREFGENTDEQMIEGKQRNKYLLIWGSTKSETDKRVRILAEGSSMVE
jgi:hypothetical protein